MKLLKQYINEKDIHNYVVFNISECTEEALEKKCEQILNTQFLEWKPLKLEYAENIKVYTKTFYYEK